MSGMIVHGIPGSPYVRAALVALEEKGAEYQFAAMPPISAWNCAPAAAFASG